MSGEAPRKLWRSPHRFDDWSWSPEVNWKQFKAWASSLPQEDAVGLGAIGWVLLHPVLMIYGLLVTPWVWNTIVFSVIYYLITALAVTTCYHRLLAHKSFACKKWVEALLIFLSTSAMEGPALGWVRNHRAHHRWLDTEKDPYDAKKGFWWSHMGWAIQPYEPERVAEVDVSDLTSNRLVMIQNDYYMAFASVTGFIFPTVFCGLLWGDYAGGFWLGAITKMSIILQAAFCVNSLAHYVGEHTYCESTTPVDNLFVQVLTTGEGFHNFHHAFPYDFRGTHKLWAYDPIKWFVHFLKFCGLAHDLKTFPDSLIEHAEMETTRNKLDRQLKSSTAIKTEDKLPFMSSADVRRRVQEGASLIIVEGRVHDVHDFLPEHPGGEDILKAYIGKDATKAFYGNIVQHTHGARKILESLSIAKLLDAKTD
jgi:stearoyl-CoA desaturase (delta-9 desaturase)